MAKVRVKRAWRGQIPTWLARLAAVPEDHVGAVRDLPLPHLSAAL